ncbi:ABC-type multidrug transport system, ATPase component [Anopheles sinensis]|uniref:ABC-type multidrug transport system, ATPase component n=1 Tax=Anopheles sinensis TaxID=74873 RepID=A0A084VN23_ANOSI|nr:ABC-type multidrug transport system, ATPase component [Anopheles sinensis]
MAHRCNKMNLSISGPFLDCGSRRFAYKVEEMLGAAFKQSSGTAPTAPDRLMTVDCR